MKTDNINLQNITDSIETREININELKLNPKNPRFIKKPDFNKLKKSMKDFPDMLKYRPILVNDENIILAGNMRYRAALDLGWDKVWYTNVEGLTAKQIKELIIKDNIGFGDWDIDMLANEWDIDELKDWGLDLDFKTEPEAVEDNYEEPENIKVDVVLGDLIEIGEHRLLCGDSTDSEQVAKLMNGKKADMVFTDPPYGVNYDGGHAVKGLRRKKLKNDNNTNIYDYSLPIMYLYSKKNTPLYLWYSDNKSLPILNAVINAGYEIRNNIIWNKNIAQFGAIGAQYKTKHEPCLYCFKKGQKTNWIGENNEVSVWDIDRNTKNEYHPTQKPIKLAEKCIKNHKVDIVLDLFLGSGSTMVAAHQLKRKCYGMELDPKYCQVIIDRMLNFDSSLEVKINGKKYKSA